MVKRRKVSGTPGSKLIEMKEDRSPSEFDDVSLARDKLKGVLQKQGRRDLGDESSDSGHDDNRGSIDPLYQPPPKKPLNINKKRRRNDVNQEVAFHHTYVMKLFDRSVDLAQFKENTPLYPICRAWMANQPCAILKGEPDIKVEPEDDDRPEGEQNDSDNEYLSSDPENDVSKVTYKMPPPIPIDDTFERYPKTEVQMSGALETINFDDPQAPSKESLLQEHIQRWSSIRADWLASSINNEERYAHSGRILHAIYKRAQKAYENC